MLYQIDWRYSKLIWRSWKWSCVSQGGMLGVSHGFRATLQDAVPSLASGRIWWVLFLSFTPDSGPRYCAGKIFWSARVTTEQEQREERPTSKICSHTLLTWFPTSSGLLESLWSFVPELLTGLVHDSAKWRRRFNRRGERVKKKHLDLMRMT